MKKTAIVLAVLVLVVATSAFASDTVGISGKSGQTRVIAPSVNSSVPSEVRAAVEYNTAGAIDTPATHGGDRDGWGTEFITRWDNNTGQDLALLEFGWPCGGWWSNFWYVWIQSEIPADPYNLEYYGSFVAAIEDDTVYPPNLYTYIDISAEEIILPAGATMYFGYGNPGMAGQVLDSGVTTFSWYNDTWEDDGDYGRTTILQFKADPVTVPTETETFGGVKALFR